MPWVEFELTTPVFERAKAVDALDRAVTLIGYFQTYPYRIELSLRNPMKPIADFVEILRGKLALIFILIPIFKQNLTV
jgi:hypothetical protein